MILIQAIIGIGISVLLLLDPPGHLKFHIFILGLELIDNGVKNVNDWWFAARPAPKRADRKSEEESGQLDLFDLSVFDDGEN